jgi:hypothetical protein
MAVTDGIERRQHVAREPACLRQHRVHHVLGEIAVEALGQGGPETACRLSKTQPIST